MPEAMPAEPPVGAPARVLAADRVACACTMLRRAARATTQLYDAALAPAGLRITQYAVLAKLDRHGPLPMTALAGALGMDRTTLTRNLGPLQRETLLSLRAAGRGRTKLVALTERGRDRLRAAFPLWQQAQRQFDTSLGEEHVRELARIAEILARFSANSTDARAVSPRVGD